MHAATLENLDQEMLFVGSCYIRKEGKVDRAGVLHDLYAAEVMINVEKR